ncbi:MAG: DUF4340 domain-containing protein [Bacteroidota bacterium]
MNKTTWLLLGLFIVGAAVLWWTQQEETIQSATTLVDADRKFKVEDAESIHKVFIAKRSGETVTLERKGDHWTYNGEFRASPSAITNVMRAVTEVQMRFKPPSAAVPNMVNNLASQGIKVELYNAQGEQLKSYYVGGATPDERGTYMIMEGSEQPYVVHIPTWGGNLRFRFTLTGDDWRDKTVFRTPMEEIQSISVEYPKQQNNSFKLNVQGSRYELAPFYDFSNLPTQKVNRSMAEAYLAEYEQIGAETFKNKYPKQDSVLQSIPFANISLTKKDGSVQQVSFYPIYVEEDNIDPTTGIKIADSYVRRYFVKSNQDFMLVQHRVFEKIFWGYESFL